MKVASLLLGCALLTGCAGGRFGFGGTAVPGSASVVKVYGPHPRISVESKGPGRLHVTFDSSEDASDCEVVLDSGSVARSLPGPVLVRLESAGNEDVAWRLFAERAGGLRVDLIVKQE